MAAVRTADLLAGLSRQADLGFGLPIGTAGRSCVLASRLALACGLGPDDVRSAYYTALLHHVGCVGFARETARLFGDDLVVNAAAGRTDTASARDVLTTFVPTLARGLPGAAARAALVAITRGARWGDAYTTAACEVGRESAWRLGLPDDVAASLFHVYDLWRGERRAGRPGGDDIPVGARIARLTGVAALFESIGGADLAVRAVRRRAGGMLDPALAARFDGAAAGWFADLATADLRRAALAAEPEPHVTASDLRPVARVFGDLADLKSTYLAGHSRAVAALARDASVRLGLPDATTAGLELAGLLHDVGRVGVSGAIWDKTAPLDDDEWEQVRLHPYYTERILAGSAELSRLAGLAGRHHERLDGSGFHRGCSADDQPTAARVLAVSDRYRSLTEARPHRPALDPDQAAHRVLDEARRGRLDADAARAMLAAAGRPVPASLRPPHPNGLTGREVEVLRLVAQGCSNAEVARRLVISRRTAEHHVQHVYAKIGTSSRAAAALFAVEHHLLR
ncbi:HD domain-containing protein [Isoptericola hypogeus]|uniref:HD domain-containing protein n=1 Tax=Isoptericola hypogeus TaxID=300179 RepID=A0ABN2JMC7_9MICO